VRLKTQRLDGNQGNVINNKIKTNLQIANAGHILVPVRVFNTVRI
jgi:hypothetical protein